MGLNEFVMRGTCMWIVQCSQEKKVTPVSSLEDEQQPWMWTESKHNWKMIWKILFVTVHSRFECTFEQFNPTISFETSTQLHQQAQLLCVSAILTLNEIRVAFLSPFLFSAPNLCDGIYLLYWCCRCCYCFSPDFPLAKRFTQFILFISFSSRTESGENGVVCLTNWILIYCCYQK